MSTSRSAEDFIKLFAISNQLLENQLDAVERDFQIDLGRGHMKSLERDETYYPQFDRSIRREAAGMAKHYEIFYCLETAIRSLINDSLEAEAGPGWWQSSRVPEKIKNDVTDRIQREMDSGTTPRSTDHLDFTNFGELGEIIKANWDVFGAIFDSRKAVEKVLASLNTLRGPIAHCSPLAEDEVVRLRLSVRDWFRLME